MDAGDWITLAAVVVAVAAAGVSYLQARRAKEQVQFARDQAWSARESARLADVSAKAAVSQAESALESVELARATAHRADQPRFEVVAHDFTHNVLYIDACMTEGPPEVSVGGDMRTVSTGNRDGDHDAETTDRELERRSVVLGQRFQITARVPTWADAVSVRVNFDCRAKGDESRRWDAPMTLDWQRPRPSKIW